MLRTVLFGMSDTKDPRAPLQNDGRAFDRRKRKGSRRTRKTKRALIAASEGEPALGIHHDGLHSKRGLEARETMPEPLLHCVRWSQEGESTRSRSIRDARLVRVIRPPSNGTKVIIDTPTATFCESQMMTILADLRSVLASNHCSCFILTALDPRRGWMERFALGNPSLIWIRKKGS